MKDDLQADFNLSHHILNYLNAQYRAHYAFVNVLQQLESPDVTPAIIQKTQENLSMVVKWNQELLAGMPLFSATWKYAETFEAQKAFELLNELKSDVKKICDILEEISNEADPLLKPEDLKFLIAANLRYVYGRENFIKGNMEFAKSQDRLDIASSFSTELIVATGDIKIATLFMKEVKESGKVTPQMAEELKITLGILKGIFRSYLHDITTFRALYLEKYTFEAAGFSTEEALPWKDLKFEAESAGYWRAYGFKADEATLWVELNLGDPCYAFSWKTYGFNAEQALVWLGLGVGPRDAAILAKAGYTPAMYQLELKKHFEKTAA